MDNILFDLDGTLTDPKEGIINSILYSLKKLDISEHSIKELDSFIGPPLRDSFIARYALSNDLADKAVEYYREYFSAKGLFENVLYEGIHELLERLGAQGYQLFVAFKYQFSFCFGPPTGPFPIAAILIRSKSF